MANRTGKGTFQKGDKRINRKGPPLKSERLDELVREIGREAVRQRDTRLTRKIRRMWNSDDPRDTKELFERGWGKVKEQVEQSGGLVIRIVREGSVPAAAEPALSTTANQE